jgi:hypothetical protein
MTESMMVTTDVSEGPRDWRAPGRTLCQVATSLPNPVAVNTRLFLECHALSRQRGSVLQRGPEYHANTRAQLVSLLNEPSTWLSIHSGL